MTKGNHYSDDDELAGRPEHNEAAPTPIGEHKFVDEHGTTWIVRRPTEWKSVQLLVVSDDGTLPLAQLGDDRLSYGFAPDDFRVFARLVADVANELGGVASDPDEVIVVEGGRS